MQDITGMISGLSRPRLLVSAARFGMAHYRRDSLLPRLLGPLDQTLSSGDAAMRLLSIEAELNTKRKAHAADYRVAQHIETLAALMVEAQHLRAAPRTVT